MKARRPTGNMLLMMMMVLGVIVVLMLVGFGIYFVVSSQKKVQSKTDALVLTAAEALNPGDRSGQMNNLVARCRELVYNSRRIHGQTLEGYRHLEPLARQLLDEARDGARIVESERARLVGLNVKSLRDKVRQATEAAGGGKATVLGMTADAPQVEDVDVGYIEGVESNVEVSEGNPELKQYDLGAGYIQKESGLYRGNINARLPSPDNDLDFKLSSLPAPVKGSVAPARLTANKVFVKTGSVLRGGQEESGVLPEQIPSAVQMDVLTRVETTARGQNKQDLKVKATAAAGGVLPPP